MNDEARELLREAKRLLGEVRGRWEWQGPSREENFKILLREIDTLLAQPKAATIPIAMTPEKSPMKRDGGYVLPALAAPDSGGMPDEPYVIGDTACPVPTLSEAVLAIAAHIELDATEEAQQEAAVLRQAAALLAQPNAAQEQKAPDSEEEMPEAEFYETQVGTTLYLLNPDRKTVSQTMLVAGDDDSLEMVLSSDYDCLRAYALSLREREGWVPRSTLEKAVEVIRVWHNMDGSPLDVWQIYYDLSPEMKEIRQALFAAPSAGGGEEKP